MEDKILDNIHADGFKFSPSGSKLAIFYKSGRIEILETQTWQIISMFLNELNSVDFVEFSSDETQIIYESSNYEENYFIIVNINTNTLIKKISVGNSIGFLQFVPEGMIQLW